MKRAMRQPNVAIRTIIRRRAGVMAGNLTAKIHRPVRLADADLMSFFLMVVHTD